MAEARFSIGIDLGTTNSAMAFVSLHGEAASEVFAVSQWDTLTGLAELPTLPSFLYLPEDAAAAQIQGREDEAAEWIVGKLARRRAGETPGRVAHSAKSWLCHHAADRSQPFLPWASEEIATERKLSPIRASALILNYLRGAWDRRFAAAGADFAFDAQEVTVTVPASFDAAAQRLTLNAAEEAGFPYGVRLLEEPQAAFYRWLEQNAALEDIAGVLGDPDAEAHHVLVVDIGGGTSDFSLFEVRRTEGAALPAIRRVAVSEHILLGGDNIDLALAHLVEPRLGQGETTLSGAQWDHLVARCRDLKEQALSADGEPTDSFPVSIPGRGSGLFAGVLSARLTRAEIDSVLLDGFFPACPADARPKRALTALKEWGLPFAGDSAVTRHLAEFLADRPRVDAVLYNGGTLYPPALRRRLGEAIAAWQDGAVPVVLENPEPDLAVARGAARFGKVLHLKQERIEAGAARAVFLEAHRRPADDDVKVGAPSLVCILPRGAAPEESFEVADLDLALRVNRPVRFQVQSTTRWGRSKVGDVVEWNDVDFHALPPLETIAKVDAEGREDRTVPVTLRTRLNELGLLQVSCVSADPEIDQSWPLAFSLRPQPGGAAAGHRAAPVQTVANAEPGAIEAGRWRIVAAFGSPPTKPEKAGKKPKLLGKVGRADRRGKAETLTATRLLDSLEKALERPKGEWNGVLVRTLWPALEGCMHQRAISVEHEETWLIVAGFLLRPGFGVALDAARIDSLWRLRTGGLCFPTKRVKLQEYILWRRVAGGLDRERQERVLTPELERLRQPKGAAPELVRLTGALERLGPELKAELIERFVETAVALARDKKHCAPYLAALGLLLNRTPLYAGPETVVPPDRVVRAWDAFSGLDWSHPELTELQTLFLRAARVTDNRSLDVDKSVRNRIAGKLEKSGVTAQKTARIRDYLPLEQSERASLFGEALPPGLVLGGDAP